MVLLVVIIVAVLVVLTAGFTTGVALRRRRRAEIEPGPAGTAAPPRAPGTAAPSPPSAPFRLPSAPPRPPDAGPAAPTPPVDIALPVRLPPAAPEAGPAAPPESVTEAPPESVTEAPPESVTEAPPEAPAAGAPPAAAPVAGATAPGDVAKPEVVEEVPADLPDLLEDEEVGALEAVLFEEQPAAPSEATFEELTPEQARGRFRDRLGRARALLGDQLGRLRGRRRIDSEVWDELEEALLLADVGVATTMELLDGLREQVDRREIADGDALLVALKSELVERMAAGDHDLDPGEGTANVWLFVGVNGVGKTTTIGKVASREARSGRRVVMAAGDTFRAAAAEQLEVWAERAGADLVRGAEGGDPGAVVFDAVQRAAARGYELVLADTAGRLHTKVNLMEELKKVRRVAERPPGQVREVLMVLDATTGQNGLVQARQFAEAVGLTGVVLTKLDGTAKGGIAVAIQSELGLPIKLVGLGEGLNDLIPFDPQAFVDALVG